MSPRLRRLQADQQSIVSAFAGHPAVSVAPLGPAPAERYRVIYSVPALRLVEGGGQIERIRQVAVEIMLPSGYPREKPYCTTNTPIFHPNFGPYVCIADYWNPGNTIVDVIVQIGDMLQYKLFNTASPLNALAARWVSENLNDVPIGDVSLIPIEPEIVLGAAQDTSTAVEGEPLSDVGSAPPAETAAEAPPVEPPVVHPEPSPPVPAPTWTPPPPPPVDEWAPPPPPPVPPAAEWVPPPPPPAPPAAEPVPPPPPPVPDHTPGNDSSDSTVSTPPGEDSP